MSDELGFTPTEEQMRQAYWYHVYEHGFHLDRRDIDAEFTRGMGQIKAQVRAEKCAQIAEELEGLADSLDEHVSRDEVYGALMSLSGRIREQGKEQGS